MTKYKAKPFGDNFQLEIVATADMEMNPIDFYIAWDLSGALAAQILGICERTFWGYSSKTAPLPVRRAAALWTKLWLLEGKKPIYPNVIPPVCLSDVH